ncbi:MAG: arginine--tRNA ligase [Desulfovibrionaceae bacterium]|nr:arginine--tRNA ligase [Desulfovibrionaceae bacterium]
MRAERYLEQALRSILENMQVAWPEKAVIEPTKDIRHGEFATNIAMTLARSLSRAPREIAAEIASALHQNEELASIEVAGPGFLNVSFRPSFWQKTILQADKEKNLFGSCRDGEGTKIQVEFVSANPTGPLHIGHGRGAAVGDALVRILRFAGYDVTAEYYINDAGRQMRLLGLSIWLRAKELAGKPVEWPEDYYKGSYIIDIARDLSAQCPGLTDLADKAGEKICFEYGMETILNGIKQDLKDFRVGHDVWFSEQSLVDRGAIEQTFQNLKEKNLSFEQDGALWFRTTDFGDDKDRVLRKSNGLLTYFASDIAYHDDKYKRGFDRVVDVWGADHHGYIPRMRAAVQAIGRKQKAFDVVLIQLVNLLSNGEQIAMSTRSGQFETLADVVKEVGTDAARFMFLSRKSDSPLDFDLELVKQRTMDNPVYYVQYAHARICSVLRKAKEMGMALPDQAEASMLNPLTDRDELDLMKTVDRFCDVASDAAANLAPHHISYYLADLAGQLHGYYARHPVLQAGDTALSTARLVMLRTVGQVIRNGLDLLGVSAPESM